MAQSKRQLSSVRPLLLLLLLVAMATVTATAFPSTSDAAGYNTEGGELSASKRQLEPPVNPAHFNSIEEFKLYMKELEAYLKLLGRQRFGKRGGGFGRHSTARHSYRRLAAGKLDDFEQRLMAALASIDFKLDRLGELIATGSV